MMMHGVAVVPELLSANASARLRRHIMQRNSALTEEEDIYVHPPTQRKAFAVDPVEDESVVVALQELSQHTVLHELLEGLLGPDPAITELAALTVYPGAAAQDWHFDVLNDAGSAVKYGRSYLHSYSLFVALQDTSDQMGPTRVCPGSHTCAHQSTADLCDRHGFSPLDEEGLWRTGDSVLFNQQLQHRGDAHTCQECPARVMFILSFNARPQLGMDHRVLAQGLYCFVHWFIWGLTWQDMEDPVRQVSWPWRELRASGLWKAADRHWGIDFLTKSIMEWGIGENGMEHGEAWRLPDLLDSWGFPRFLHGRLTDDENAYHSYIDSTLENMWNFLVRVNMYIAAAFVMSSIFVLTFQRFIGSKASLLRTTAISRLVLLGYVVPALIWYGLAKRIEQSSWGRNIRKGLTFREPFPSFHRLPDKYESLLPVGPTTQPERTDVLIGSRFDSTFLGAYERWLDYHPGNLYYGEALAAMSGHVSSYRGLPVAFQDQLVKAVVDSMSGRMLLQDWLTGNWIVLDNDIRDGQIRRDMLKANDDMLQSVDQTISRLLAYARFDAPHRETALALETQFHLTELRERLLFSATTTSFARGSGATEEQRSDARVRSYLPPIPRTRDGVAPTRTRRRFLQSSNVPSIHWFRVGDMVMVRDEEEWYRGAIFEIVLNGKEDAYFFGIGYEDGTDEVDVPLNQLLPLIPLEEGDRVYCHQRSSSETNHLEPAIVTEIKPDGALNVQSHHVDGLAATNLPPGSCLWDPRLEGR
jgi:hypothetical protein